MKIVVEQSDLSEALDVVRSTVPNRNTIPLLSCILFVAGDGRLSMTSTSMDMQSDVVIPADVSAPGAVCIPAEILHGAVKGFAKGSQVSLALGTDGRIAVASGKSKLAIKSLGPEEFPAAPNDEFDAVFDVDAVEFLRGMSAVSYATYDGGVDRPALHGMMMQIVGKHLRMVATDGHRLAEFKMAAPAEAMPQIIIGNTALKTFMSVLKDAEQATISISPSRIMIRVGNATVRSQLVAAEYPEYERVIPKVNGTCASIYAETLTEATDRASAVFNGMNKAPAVTISAGADGLILHALSKDGNEATEEADANIKSQFNIALNPRYIKDMAKAWPYPGQPINIHYTSAASPLLFDSDDHPNIRAVIMPTRG